jgi:hypothetical protein
LVVVVGKANKDTKRTISAEFSFQKKKKTHTKQNKTKPKRQLQLGIPLEESPIPFNPSKCWIPIQQTFLNSKGSWFLLSFPLKLVSAGER